MKFKTLAEALRTIKTHALYNKCKAYTKIRFLSEEEFQKFVNWHDYENHDHPETLLVEEGRICIEIL